MKIKKGNLLTAIIVISLLKSHIAFSLRFPLSDILVKESGICSQVILILTRIKVLKCDCGSLEQ